MCGAGADVHIQDSDVLEETDARTRLSRSKASVIIETLQAGSLGLPLKAEPTYAVPGPNGEGQQSRAGPDCD
jgi:hypothetical protein